MNTGNDYRDSWPGWNNLPPQGELEGNTGLHPNYQKVIYDLVKECQPKIIVEIGFNAGHGACCMLAAAPTEVQFYSFDIGRHGYEEDGLNALSSIYDITLTLGPSKDTVSSYLSKNNIEIDFAFIDGCHGGGRNKCCAELPPQLRCPYIDIDNCKKHLAVGGVIFVDDMEICDVPTGYHNTDWTNYEDLTYIADGYPSEKPFKIMRKVK